MPPPRLMSPREMVQHVITPALALLPSRMDSNTARGLLLAIQGQEDQRQRRRQHPRGPARGLWQFEKGGGVLGVLRHPASADLAQQVCLARHVKPEPRPVWMLLQEDDILAAVFARLLLWTDAKPLPINEADGWDYYIRTWRPGAPHRERWGANWNRAVEAVG